MSAVVQIGEPSFLTRTTRVSAWATVADGTASTEPLASISEKLKLYAIPSGFQESRSSPKLRRLGGRQPGEQGLHQASTTNSSTLSDPYRLIDHRSPSRFRMFYVSRIGAQSAIITRRRGWTIRRGHGRECLLYLTYVYSDFLSR